MGYLTGLWESAIGFVVYLSSFVLTNWKWLALTSGAMLAILITRATAQAHRNWRKGWLSELTDQRLAEIRGKRGSPFRAAVSTGWRQRADRMRIIGHNHLAYLSGDALPNFGRGIFKLHIPSLVSFVWMAFFITMSLGLCVLLGAPPVSTEVIGTADKPNEQVVAVFSGLAVVMVALVVFVAESIREDADSERRAILLKLSALWPLGMAATLTPFVFFWPGPNRLMILPIAALGALTLYSFAKVIAHLIDPDKQEKNRLALQTERIRSVFFDSMRQRAANNILHEKISKEKTIDGLKMGSGLLSMSGGVDKYIFIEADGEGRLSDIHLDELSKFIRRLDQAARSSLNLGLGSDRPAVRAEPRGELVGVAGHEPAQWQSAYLMKRVGEIVPRVSSVARRNRNLIALPREFEQVPELIAEARANIRNIFRFAAEEPPSEGFRRQLQMLKDRLAAAIGSKSLGAVETQSSAYVHICETFIQLFTEHGGAYDAEQAQQERSSIFDGWSEIRWLVSDVRELITLASDSDNPDIVDQICSIPSQIAVLAVTGNDHFLFQEFTELYGFIYFKASAKIEDTSARTILIDRACKHPCDIIKYFVYPELDDRTAPAAAIRQKAEFARYILRVLQGILKRAVEYNDAPTVQIVLEAIKQLRPEARADNWINEVAILQYRLAHDDADREKSEQAIEWLEARIEAARMLTSATHLIVFAVSGWVLDRPDGTATRSYWQTLKTFLPNEIVKLTQIFSEASKREAGDQWGWGWWDLRPNEPRWIDTHSRLNKAYVLKALEVISALPEAERTSIRLPSGHDIARLARADGQLLKLIDSLAAEPLALGVPLEEEKKSAIPALRAALVRVESENVLEERKKAQAATLDAEKIRIFGESFLEHHAKFVRLRALFAKEGAYVDKPDERPGESVSSLGYNNLDDKRAFIAQEDAHYGPWGMAYGEGLARTEDDRIFAALVGGAGRKIVSPHGLLVATAETAVATMESPIIVHSLDFQTERREWGGSEKFVPSYDARCKESQYEGMNGFDGLLLIAGKSIPIFELRVEKSTGRNKVLVADLKRYARWSQFNPADSAEEDAFINGMFLVRIIDLNEDSELRHKIAEAPPTWLESQNDKEDYLKSRVAVNIFEKFQVDVLDPSFACSISVIDSGEAVGE